jgi:HAD superfamily hydrolase (TIGR01509 family)
MISAILFDFGGTLDADGLHWLDRFYSIYERNGLSNIPRSSIKEAFYWADAKGDVDPAMRTAGFRDMMNLHVRWQFEKLGLQNPDLQKTIAAGFYRPAERILHRNRHILEELRLQGLKLGVVSNFYGNVEALCREAAFCDFAAILDSAIVGLKKPDPAFFSLALEKLNVPAAETAFVGDSFERDIVPAKALGMRTYWLIGDQERKPPVPGQADGVLRSLEDLPARIATDRAANVETRP